MVPFNSLLAILVFLSLISTILIMALMYLSRKIDKKDQKIEALNTTLLTKTEDFIRLSAGMLSSVDKMYETNATYNREMVGNLDDMKNMIRSYMENLKFDIRDINSKIK